MEFSSTTKTDKETSIAPPHADGPAADYSRKLGEIETRDWESLFGLAQSCGHSFLPAYEPIVERRRGLEYGERERNFQLYRRGRYVEFNLVYDRAPSFGPANQRTHRIHPHVSSPLVRWEYGYEPEPGTREAQLYEEFLKPQDWANWTATSESI